jgi:acyl-CoA dehydrogenase
MYPTFKNEAQELWLDRMSERGWTTPAWPRSIGGGGLSKEQSEILHQELVRIKARPALLSFGIWMLGPVLLKYGSEAQKARFLPDIVRGKVRWCQGYSEPGSGSDLASLQTRAEDRGDHYLVNGSKIWTSYGDKADWVFCLVRTDNAAPKHEGISFLLFDMKSPGVTTKPITLISGKSPFSQLFFDDVRVPKENLVGEINRGWEIAKYLLTHEREMIGDMGTQSVSLSELAKEHIGLRNDMLVDPILRTDISRFTIDEMAFSDTLKRAADEAKAGQEMGAVSSMFKYFGTELNMSRFELMLSVTGNYSLGWEGEEFDEGNLPRAWLRSKGNAIEGGTSEIQLNIIAKRVLGLPSE